MSRMEGREETEILFRRTLAPTASPGWTEPHEWLPWTSCEVETNSPGEYTSIWGWFSYTAKENLALFVLIFRERVKLG